MCIGVKYKNKTLLQLQLQILQLWEELQSIATLLCLSSKAAAVIY